MSAPGRVGRRLRWRRRLVAPVAVVAASGLGGGVAAASWSLSSSSGSAGSAAVTMPAGNVPAAVAAGADVNVSWAASVVGGSAVAGYVVRAYDATTSAARAVAGTCAGTVAATSCTDSSAPAGSWRYTVQPRHGAWAGAESGLSAAVSTDTTPPAPSALALVNGSGGTVGVLNQGDRVEITYSERLRVASLCSTWSGDTVNQSLTGNGDVTVTVANNGANDTLTVSVGSCTFNLGSVALGRDYVSATATFVGNGSNRSEIQWDATLFKLTITIGRRSTGTVGTTAQSAATVTYTPSTSIRDVAGNAMVAAAFNSANQRF